MIGTSPPPCTITWLALQGDVVSVTGKGRLTLTEVTTTKKEKFVVRMTVSR